MPDLDFDAIENALTQAVRETPQFYFREARWANPVWESQVSPRQSVELPRTNRVWEALSDMYLLEMDERRETLPQGFIDTGNPFVPTSLPPTCEFYRKLTQAIQTAHDEDRFR